MKNLLEAIYHSRKEFYNGKDIYWYSFLEDGKLIITDINDKVPPGFVRIQDTEYWEYSGSLNEAMNILLSNKFDLIKEGFANMNSKYETWSDDDLNKEMGLILKVVTQRKKQKELEKSKNLCINGIIAKDVAVEYGSDDGSDITDDTNDVYFSFFIKHDNKKYDIYYESGKYDDNHNFTLHSWWPLSGKEGDDDFERNGAFQFIPRGFGELSENNYEFNGTFKEAITRLKECGITDVTKGNW